MLQQATVADSGPSHALRALFAEGPEYRHLTSRPGLHSNRASPHIRGFALFILTVLCARSAVADHARRPTTVAALPQNGLLQQVTQEQQPRHAPRHSLPTPQVRSHLRRPIYERPPKRRRCLRSERAAKQPNNQPTNQPTSQTHICDMYSICDTICDTCDRRGRALASLPWSPSRASNNSNHYRPSLSAVK